MTSASVASWAMTVTAATSVRAGAPVAGSMRWWRSSPSTVQCRRARELVARAPATRSTTVAGVSGSAGSSMAMRVGVALGQAAADAQVPAEVDQGRLGPADEEVDGDEVGGPALADPAEVQVGADGQGHAPRRRVEEDARTSRRREGHRGRGGAGPGADLFEGPVVAGLDDRVEDGGVEAVAGAVPGPDGGA